MTESGRVVKTEKNYAFVRIDRKTACDKCGMCGMTKADKHIDIRAENPENAAIGDVVTVELGDSSALLSSLIVYLVPLFFAAIGLLLGQFLKIGEGLSFALFMVFLVGGYAIVSLIDKAIRNKKKSSFVPKIVNVMKVPCDNDK